MTLFQIVNKLIQFLVGIVQPRLSPGVKRRMPQQLAIEDIMGPSGSKEQKLDPAAVVATASSSSGQSLGPVISELPNESVNNDLNSQVLYIEHTDGNTVPVTIQMPKTPEASKASEPLHFMKAVDPTAVNPALNTGAAGNNKGNSSSSNMLATTVTGRPVLQREISKEDVDMDVSFLQKDLDNLKELLSGQVTLDPNFISSLFSPDDPLPNLVYPTSVSPNPLTAAAAANAKAASNQLQLKLDNNGKDQMTSTTLTPSLFELVDEEQPIEAPHQQQPPQPQQQQQQQKALEAADLNTPLITLSDENPLMKSLQK